MEERVIIKALGTLQMALIRAEASLADAAARAGASGFVAAQVGKLARQLDDDSLWLLTATTPTWVQVGGGSGSGAFLRADGSVAGATGAAQDFGSNGIKTDVIAESSAGGDVTVGGVLTVEQAGNVGVGAGVTPGAAGAILTVYQDSASLTNQVRVEQDGTGDATISMVLTGVAGWMIGLDNSDSDKFKISCGGAGVGSGGGGGGAARAG